MWDHTDGCANQFSCASGIYLLSCLALELCIKIDRAVGELRYGKYIVGVPNSRYKQIIKLETEKILNS